MFNNAHVFDINLNSWDVSKVTNMINMFVNAKEFDRKLCWNTISVTGMLNMFEGSPGSLQNYPACLGIMFTKSSRAPRRKSSKAPKKFKVFKNKKGNVVKAARIAGTNRISSVARITS